jgi:hypothetical protein
VPHHISEFLISIVDYIPALFLDEGSANFRVVRALSLLVVVALLVAVLALVGHFRFKAVAYFKTLSSKSAAGPKHSNIADPPNASESSNSANVVRMTPEPTRASNNPKSPARR